MLTVLNKYSYLFRYFHSKRQCCYFSVKGYLYTWEQNWHFSLLFKLLKLKLCMVRKWCFQIQFWEINLCHKHLLCSIKQFYIQTNTKCKFIETISFYVFFKTLKNLIFSERFTLRLIYASIKHALMHRYLYKYEIPLQNRTTFISVWNISLILNLTKLKPDLMKKKWKKTAATSASTVIFNSFFSYASCARRSNL